MNTNVTQFPQPPQPPMSNPGPRHPANRAQDFLKEAIELYNLDAGCKEARNAVLIALVIELRQLNRHNAGWR